LDEEISDRKLLGRQIAWPKCFSAKQKFGWNFFRPTFFWGNFFRPGNLSADFFSSRTIFRPTFCPANFFSAENVSAEKCYVRKKKSAEQKFRPKKLSTEFAFGRKNFRPIFFGRKNSGRFLFAPFCFRSKNLASHPPKLFISTASYGHSHFGSRLLDWLTHTVEHEQSLLYS